MGNNQIDRARVLEVRIHLPPAESLVRTRFSRERLHKHESEILDQALHEWLQTCAQAPTRDGSETTSKTRRSRCREAPPRSPGCQTLLESRKCGGDRLASGGLVQWRDHSWFCF